MLFWPTELNSQKVDIKFSISKNINCDKFSETEFYAWLDACDVSKYFCLLFFIVQNFKELLIFIWTILHIIRSYILSNFIARDYVFRKVFKHELIANLDIVLTVLFVNGLWFKNYKVDFGKSNFYKLNFGKMTLNILWNAKYLTKNRREVENISRAQNNPF